MTARTRILSVLDPHARRADEHGYVLVLTAMILIPLLLISAMAVDYGAWYTDGSRMQRASDAAALAGVVWLPDLATATTVAQSTAKSDGFDDALSNITVAVSKLSDYELKVVITDTAGKVFLSSFVKKNVTISRTSTAKYVLPVPLGSPHNYFGTDNFISGAGAEGFYAAINGTCQSKYQGDPFAVPYISNTASQTNACTASNGHSTNTDYIDPSGADQYQYYITVPPSRAQNIYVDIWNPGGNESGAGDPGGSNTPTTTYTLYAADSTPLDDSDNPVLSAANKCATSTYPNPFTASSSFAGSTRTMLGQAGWYDMCIIPTTAPAGKYVLGIKNSSSDNSTVGGGLNGYAVMASYANTIGTACDNRTDATCPQVAGKNWISIYANGSGSTAVFYLAQIDAQYAGKTLLITLYDPGEGGNYIQILDPTGAAKSFVATDEGIDGNTPGTPSAPETQLSVVNSPYNGHFVQLSLSLSPTYGTSPALSQFWWQIKYVFSSGTVTDRTTWGVRVLGNPVHLTS